MQTEILKDFKNIGTMKKRRVLMADGRRYLIYYTFEPAEKSERETKQKGETTKKTEARENV